MGEVKEDEEIKLMPNPATNEFKVESLKLKVKRIKITNLIGEIIKSEDFGIGKNTLEIDVGNIPRGLYFLEAETEKGVVRRKFVKE